MLELGFNLRLYRLGAAPNHQQRQNPTPWNKSRGLPHISNFIHGCVVLFKFCHSIPLHSKWIQLNKQVGRIHHSLSIYLKADASGGRVILEFLQVRHNVVCTPSHDFCLLNSFC